MKLEIPFNDSIFKNQMSLNFKLTWKNNLRHHKVRLSIGILMILFGILVINGGGSMGYVLIGFGISYITRFIDNLLNYRKSKKQYNRLVNAEIIGQVNSKENTVWEFNEDEFCYQDYKIVTKLKWVNFTGFRLIDSSLFLDINVGPTLSYIISEEEIDKNQFQIITDIVKKKIGPGPVHNKELK